MNLIGVMITVMVTYSLLVLYRVLKEYQRIHQGIQ